METAINDWLKFAGRVERELTRLGDAFSADYVQNITHLTASIREEAKQMSASDKAENHEAFLRLNRLGIDLKSTAYFVG